MPKRPLLLLLFLAAGLARAQPALDEAGVAAAFTRIVALAGADSVEAAFPLLACPVADAAGALVAVPCDPARIDHRVRVEWQLALVRHFFSEAPAALRPHYAAEEEGDMGFHLLLFRDLPAVPFALVTFTDVDDRHLFIEVQTEEEPAGVRYPASLVATLEALLTAAGDATTTVETFAPLVVARGDDPARAWRAPADPARADERAFVAALLDDLRRLTAGAGGYTVTGFDVDYEDEGVWHVLLVRFDGVEAPLAFAFLPLGDTFPSGSARFLLGDVDG